MSLNTRVLIGLGAGLLAGVGIAPSPQLAPIVAIVEPVGVLWVNAILMTIVPLVVSSLIVGIAKAPDARGIGLTGMSAIGLFAALVTANAIVAAAIMPTVFAWLPVDSAALESMRERAATSAAPGAAAALPTFGQWLLSLIPSNAIKAAADGAMLPLIVFVFLFALALTRIATELRERVVGFFDGIAAAVTVLLGWIITVAPIGIFALALPLGARIGVTAFATVGYYLLVASITLAAFTLGLYAVAVFAGRTSLCAFAEAAAPAQALAFGSHSSLASLPAMIDAAKRLGLPPSATQFVLPLAVALFKFAPPIWFVIAACFIGQLYGVPVGPAQLVPTVLVGVLASFATAGVPSGSVYLAAPVLVAAGLPTEGIGLLLALDAIPDAFRTLANVTADLTTATVLARTRPREAAEGEAIARGNTE
jgi:proton glutamate symport protein